MEYTHRVAISRRRLIHLDEQAGRITFSYRSGDKIPQRKNMDLPLDEFLRRYCLHILPRRLVKIRHYGLLANRDRDKHLRQARAVLGGKDDPKAQEPIEPAQSQGESDPVGEKTSDRLRICPQCGRRALRRIDLQCAPIRGSPATSISAPFFCDPETMGA